MSNDYKQGYRDGFKDGLEEGKKQSDKSFADGYAEGMKKTIPPPYVPKGPVYAQNETCPKCGIKISGVMGYVCSSINCPIFYQATCQQDYAYDAGLPLTGAVGSEVSYTYAKGTNGPAGYVEPKKQYDDRGWRIK